MFAQVFKLSILSLLFAAFTFPLCVLAVPTESESVKFVYDANGNMVQYTTDTGTMHFEYDAYNRKIATINATGAKRMMEYDARGNLTAFVDETGNRTLFTYNVLNQLVASQDALGHVTRASLDANNNLDVLTDALGGEIGETHDALSRLTSITNAVGQTTRYTYTPDGGLSERIKADGSWIRYHRNDLGWMTGVTYSDGTSVSIGYDAFGNMVHIKDSDTEFRYTYDDKNRLVKVTDVHLGVSISYAYDALGRRTQMVDASGTVVTYQYDSQSRPTAISRAGKVEIAYEYDSSGLYVKETLGNGITVEKIRDSNGRILNRSTFSADGETLSKITYQRDLRGFVIKERRELRTQNRGIDKSILTYQYDAIGQLVKETRTDEDTGGLLYWHRYEYDAQNNRIKKISHDATVVRYTYDEAGRLLRETVKRPSVANTYSVFNAFGTQLSFDDFRNADTQEKVIEYTYDDNGNLVREQLGAQVVTYEYDIEGRLIALDSPHGRTEYVLTPDGKRVGIVKAGETTRFMHDNFDVNLEVGATQTSYLSALGIDQVLLKEDSGERFYYHRGTANSVFHLSNEGGDVVNTYDYDAFGQPVSTHEGVENDRTFSARTSEASADTYYFRERLYSSRTGRFLSVDPIRAADANRSFRIGSLPGNTDQEPETPIYQQRLTPSGYTYTGEPAPVSPLTSVGAVESSPLFEQRLISSTMGLDVNGYTYVGNNPTNHTDPTGEIVKWNPLSFSISSGCLFSKCAGSVCISSGCAGSVCAGSVCIGSSGCGTSICRLSGCVGPTTCS